MIWPLPALLCWALAWASYFLLTSIVGLSPLWAMPLSAAVGVLCARSGSSPWRKGLMAAGFPVSFAASGLSVGLPAWAWLIPLLLLLALYPARTWRDAPVFPTPRGAFAELKGQLPVPDGAAILDGGCGLGDGLIEWHRTHPHACLEGVEWSRPLVWVCRLRLALAKIPARVWAGDLWATDWSRYQLVYLFQRPESMPRAMEKASREMPAGSVLVSLEFEATAWQADGRCDCPDGRPLWWYRLPLRAKG